MLYDYVTRNPKADVKGGFQRGGMEQRRELESEGLVDVG